MALEFDSYPRILKLLLVITYLFFVGTFHVIRHIKSAKLKYLLG